MSGERNHAAAPAGPLRRDVLKGAAAVTFAIGTGGLVSIGRGAAAAKNAATMAPNVWVTIGADDVVTIVFPATELGQGSSTALPVILAEELDADWETVKIEQLDEADRTYGNPIFGNFLYTAGSSAVRGYFEPLRRAGAQARQVLIRAAADHWGVPVSEVTTEAGTVVHEGAGRRLRYGALVAEAAMPTEIPDPADVALKRREDFRLIGGDVPRRDIPGKSRGAETYAIDVRVPGMVYAAIERSPVEGEHPEAIDDTKARETAGVIDVVALPDAVAVVAETIEGSFRGRDALSVTWSTDSPARDYDSEAALALYREAAARDDERGAVWKSRGDTIGALGDAARVVTADYASDYAYHGQMEPVACAAAVDEDGKGAELWVSSQTQSWSMHSATETLETTPERIRMHMMPMGGSFGRRTELEQNYVRDALLVSRTVGRPVKLVWTREDDVRHGRFRPLMAQRLRAGLDSDGRVVAWNHKVAGTSVIADFNPMRWERVKPVDVISMLGAGSRFYAIPNLLAEHVILDRQARLAPWRGVGASYTSFAAECFVDELAEAAGSDPVDFRLRLLAENPRGRKVLETVAAMAGWPDGAAEGRALGLSFAGYHDSLGAGIAEVSVDEENGTIRVHRFWAAVDPGLVVSRRNTEAQVEGGIVYALSSALMERITVKDGQVQQSNFNDYPILRANEVPDIAVEIIEGSDEPTGVGELGTPMVPAAVANAVHAATGRRLRHMPFTPDRVKATLTG